MVSIILVTYNRAKRLRLSIQDILSQTFSDFELIICDDCSPDNTEEVCREFESRDSRIRYFRHSQNKQMPGNLNFGIQQAKYEYVAILHDGDRFRRDLIEQWFNAISRHDTVGVVFNTLADSDHQDRIVRINGAFSEGLITREHLLHHEYFKCWMFSSPIYGEAMLRKSVVQAYGYLNPEYSFYADVDLWMEILQTYDAYYCADPLIKTPLKTVQPQEFKDDIVMFSMLLLNIHKKHRIKAFKNRPTKLVVEMVRYYWLVLLRTVYIQLLVTKNFSFDYFIRSPRKMSSRPYLLPVWTGFLIFYPLIRWSLRTFIRSKSSPTPDQNLVEQSKFMFQR